MVTRCAVLGSPIAHSLSPVLHRAAYDALGLDWSYDAVEVESSGLAGFLDGLGSEWRGLSLTMPLKRTVMPLLHSYDEWAARSGAANTIVRDEGVLAGFNTDIPGAVNAIRERTTMVPSSALVLGGGATATSLLLAAASLGCTSATIAVRDPERARETLEAVGEAMVLEVVPLSALRQVRIPDLVVSTIPGDAVPAPARAALSEAPLLFDVIYHPWPTPLAAAAQGVVINGLDLLVHQAALQVQLMTGRDEPVIGVMRAAGERALGE